MAYYINRQAPMSGISSLLALKGRQGDSELVHMSKPEMNLLQRMGKLTINPKTGLPEAFNLQDSFEGIAGLLNQDISGKQAMQELINFGRNKLADYNADDMEEEEMAMEEQLMQQQSMQMAPQQPQQMEQPQMPMMNQGGLLALLSAGKQPSSAGKYFEGMVDGKGDGMSDEIEFKVDGDPQIKKARLSRDEYVIAADVVSELGNGSSDAGAEKLDKFMQDVRHKANGTGKQMNQINGDKIIKELT